MNELKSCPFCGGEAEIVTLDPYYKNGKYGVCCSECPAILAECATYKRFDTEAEAVAAWNTRAATTIGKVQVEIEPVLRGTLTAEQVSKATYAHSIHADCADADWQAIADELNARAERTCRIVKTWSDSDYVDDWNYRCSECGGYIPVNERDPETGDVISAANYCPQCGGKVER